MECSSKLHIVGEDLLRVFDKLFHLRFWGSSGQWKKHFIEEVLSNFIWETFLYEHIFNCNSYKFSYKFAFIRLLYVHGKLKSESKIQLVSCLVMKNIYRSSYPEVFLRKGVLKICSKFTGEHPYRSAISIKLQSNFVYSDSRSTSSKGSSLHVISIRIVSSCLHELPATF